MWESLEVKPDEEQQKELGSTKNRSATGHQKKAVAPTEQINLGKQHIDKSVSAFVVVSGSRLAMALSA